MYSKLSLFQTMEVNTRKDHDCFRIFENGFSKYIKPKAINSWINDSQLIYALFDLNKASNKFKTLKCTPWNELSLKPLSHKRIVGSEADSDRSRWRDRSSIATPRGIASDFLRRIAESKLIRGFAGSSPKDIERRRVAGGRPIVRLHCPRRVSGRER